jgi:hypothetical protein
VLLVWCLSRIPHITMLLYVLCYVSHIARLLCDVCHVFQIQYHRVVHVMFIIISQTSFLVWFLSHVLQITVLLVWCLSCIPQIPSAGGVIYVTCRWCCVCRVPQITVLLCAMFVKYPTYNCVAGVMFVTYSTYHCG